jgi:hypothetical protein
MFKIITPEPNLKLESSLMRSAKFLVAINLHSSSAYISIPSGLFSKIHN